MTGSSIRVIVVDIDGTLTVSPEEYSLHLRAVEVIRRLRKEGYKVVLASGNSVPMVLGLARYIDSSDTVVAENGGAIAHSDSIKWLCDAEEMSRLVEIERILAESMRSILKKSWQNDFMKCSKAFKIIRSDLSVSSVVNMIKSVLRDNDFNNYSIAYSKFAIHLNPRTCDKASAVEEILKLYNYSWDNTLAIGDSEIDREMLIRARYGCVVSNAPIELSKEIKCRSQYPAGEGFIDIVKNIIGLE
ncbi:MAG: phosphoglycolate phosphatase [Sulfolobales archaeon]